MYFAIFFFVSNAQWLVTNFFAVFKLRTQFFWLYDEVDRLKLIPLFMFVHGSKYCGIVKYRCFTWYSSLSIATISWSVANWWYYHALKIDCIFPINWSFWKLSKISSYKKSGLHEYTAYTIWLENIYGIRNWTVCKILNFLPSKWNFLDHFDFWRLRDKNFSYKCRPDNLERIHIKFTWF